jgi:hypothetical protein
VRCVAPCGVQLGQAIHSKGPEAAARTPPPLPLRASPSPVAAGCRPLPRPPPTAVTSSSSVSAPWSLLIHWMPLSPSGTRCRRRACRLVVHCHRLPTPMSPSPPRAPNQPFHVTGHLPDPSSPPSRHRSPITTAATTPWGKPLLPSPIQPLGHQPTGGWDGHFGPKEHCSLLFLVRILFKSIQNFKPSEIHRNSNKFDKNINSIPLLNLPFSIE